MSTTPKAALAAIAGAREAAAEAIAGGAPDAVAAAFERLKAHCDVLGALDDPAEADATQAWQRVADALHDLMAWLEEPAPDAKAAMTRDQKIKLAVAVATRGRGRARRRDAADAILDGFYGGLGAILKGSWRALKLGVRGLVAAGEVVGRGVHAGAVHVDAYIRNGKPVRAHDRGGPGKAVGAHLLYR